MALAFGMACCILIRLWVRDEVSFDKERCSIFEFATLKTVNTLLRDG
jgi:hypothetical protein